MMRFSESMVTFSVEVRTTVSRAHVTLNLGPLDYRDLILTW